VADGPGRVRAGLRLRDARTRWRLAEALAEAGRRDEAADQWRQAAQTADKLKARPLRAALDDLARRARIGTPEQRGDGAVLASLTSREREVLRLIAAGRSNREIASVLFIAPKTASVHVSNILGKLGAASRTEAAAIAHREGLISQPSPLSYLTAAAYLGASSARISSARAPRLPA
jgi:DNA-binding NarL/FixJ family response regulator